MARSIESIIKHPVPTYHHTTYPAIDPAQSSLTLKGKTALITGGGQGISRAIATSYAKAGITNLILLARRIEPIDAAKADIEATYLGTKVYTYGVSVTNSDAVAATFKDIRAKIGDIDILILSVTDMGAHLPVLSLTAASFLQTISVNVIGNLDVVQQYLSFPSTLERPKTILELSSANAHCWVPTQTVYGTTKAMFTTMLSEMADDVKLDGSQPGLRCHSFHPGVVLTEAVKK